jgi:putative ABC transport system permease protein
VIGGVGGVIGTGLGFLVARPMVGTVSSLSEKAAGVVSRVHATTLPIAAGVAIGLLVGAVSAWVPARRATRLDIVSELQQRGGASDAPPRVRVRLALVWTAVAALGLAASVAASLDGSLHPWQLIAGDVGIISVAIGSVVGVGAWAPLVVAAAQGAVARAQWASRLRTLPLALVNLTRQPKRTGAMALAIAGAVGMAAGLSNAVPSMNVGIGHAFAAYAAGRIDVTTLTANNSGTIDSKVPPAVETAITRIPGVAGIDHASFINVNGQGAVSVADGVGNYAYPIVRGVPSAVAFARGEIMVGTGLARSKHLSPGSLLSLPTLGGVTAVRVGGIWQDPNDMGSAVTVGPGVLSELYGAQPPNELFVRVAAGASVDEVAQRIRDARLDPRLHVYTPTQYGSELAREIRAFLNPFWVMQRVWLAVALIAVLASLLLIGIQRRREHGILAAVGMGPRLLGRLTLVEGAVIGLTGSVLGLLSSFVIEEAFTRVAGILFGLSVPVRVAVPPSLLYALIGTLVVLVGALLPAWRSSRLEVVEALRYE